jgi:hypothetical protein
LRFPAANSHMIRKGFAILTLFSLLLASLPALAESLSASGLPPCCNTVYCPLHHRQARDLERDKSLCGAAGQQSGNDCSMRACDAPSSAAVGAELYVLAAPVAIPLHFHGERAPIQASAFFLFHLNLPSTPPPRALPV